MYRIKVLLADDQILFVESLRKVITARARDIEIVGVAYDGRQAIQLAAKLNPDIALIDIKMPELNGVEATEVICKRHPDTKVMILTTYDDDEFVFEALKRGARGYLLKDIPPEELIVTIRALNAGAAQISPNIAARLVNQRFAETRSAAGTSGASRSNPSWYEALLEKEKKILTLLCRGYSNKEIADRLHLAVQTVKNYLSIIYEKIFVLNRAAAIKKTIESGIRFDDE